MNINLSRVYLYFGLAGIRIRVENSRAPSTSGWFRALFLALAAIPPVVTPLYKPRDPDTQHSQRAVLGWPLLPHYSWLMLRHLRAWTVSSQCSDGSSSFTDPGLCSGFSEHCYDLVQVSYQSLDGLSSFSDTDFDLFLAYLSAPASPSNSARSRHPSLVLLLF